MTLEELKTKYGTHGISMVVRDLASRHTFTPGYAKEIETMLADLESVLVGKGTEPVECTGPGPTHEPGSRGLCSDCRAFNDK
mgnify:CR=1 FL=1